jgi:hypothetical protein
MFAMLLLLNALLLQAQLLWPLLQALRCKSIAAADNTAATIVAVATAAVNAAVTV